jgi:membrane protease YdiL (CAAX protease family)
MRESLKTAHPIIQAGVLTLLGFGAMFILMSMVFVILAIIGEPISILSDPSALRDPQSTGVFTLKVLQIIQSIGLFVTPYLIYTIIIKDKGYALYSMKGRWGMLAVFSLTMVAALPLINFLAEWNSGLHLPAFLSELETWMRSTEKDAENLIKTFLTMETYGELFFNLFLIALLPAIGEEVFFRGMIQPLVLKSIKNPHLAVWITAFIFSFFHMQFLGFVPRFILGGILGYAAHWSGSLVLPMVGHFLNNGLAVLATWYISRNQLTPEVEQIGANDGELTIVLTSVGIICAGLISLYFSHLRLQKKTTPAAP